MSERIQGRCPACGGDGSLFVASGGYLTCSRMGCPNPCAASDLLSDPLLNEHVVRFGATGFDIQHPLAERGKDLVACELHQHIRSLDGPPTKPGRYIARRTGAAWAWEEIA